MTYPIHFSLISKSQVSPKKKYIAYFLYASLTFFSGQLFAWHALTNKININCAQVDTILSCQFRLFGTTPPASIKAYANEKEIAISKQRYFPGPSDTVIILFLADTGKQTSQDIFDKKKEHIRQLIGAANPNYQLGLATFDEQFTIKTPLGASKIVLNESVSALQASSDATSKLYRGLLKAIQELNKYDAARKAIFLLSDGYTEDKIYFHSDIIKIARKNGVIINSIGYPVSKLLPFALQTIQNLSKATGGIHTETNTEYYLPEKYINEAFTNLEQGEVFAIDLNQVNADTLRLEIATDSVTETLSIPVESTIKSEKKPIANASRALPFQIITQQTASEPVSLWLWYGLPVSFIVIVLLIMTITFFLWPSWRHTTAKNGSNNFQYRPYAYLVENNEANTHHPITKSIWRIGRNQDNNTALDDMSVSRLHAEIHRNNNGHFDIVDLNSINGVYLNEKKIEKAILTEGDIIEIGNISLQFTHFFLNYTSDEPTQTQNTKVPGWEF